MKLQIIAWEASLLYLPNFGLESKVDCKHFPSYTWNPLQALVEMAHIEFLLLKCNVKVMSCNRNYACNVGCLELKFFAYYSSLHLKLLVLHIWITVNAQYRKLKLIIMPDKMYHRLPRSLQFWVVRLKWFVFLTIMCFMLFLKISQCDDEDEKDHFDCWRSFHDSVWLRWGKIMLHFL